MKTCDMTPADHLTQRGKTVIPDSACILSDGSNYCNIKNTVSPLLIDSPFEEFKIRKYNLDDILLLNISILQSQCKLLRYKIKR